MDTENNPPLTDTNDSANISNTQLQQDDVIKTFDTGTDTETNSSENTDEQPAKKEEQEIDIEKSEKYRLMFSEASENSLLSEPIFKVADIKEDTIAALPVTDAKTMREYIESYPKDKLSGERGRAWADTIDTAQYSGYPNNFMIKPLRDRKRKWRQGVKTDKGKLGLSVPRWKENDITNMTGRAAVLRIRSLLGTASTIQVPLWHSGFYVTLECPGDSEILELERRISEEKVRIGRQTWGYAFSNESVYIVKELADFAVAHIYTSTLNSVDQENILQHISSLDIPSLAWGLACLMYPNGFKYRRPILDPNQVETVTVDELLNVREMQIVDHGNLTPWQISHMANRNSNSMSSGSIAKYREEFTIGKGTVYEIDESVKINIETPNLEKYILNGTKWVNSIVDMVNDILTKDSSVKERNELIAKHSRATVLRQYGHMVSSISVGSREITDADTINDILSDMSSNDKIRPEFYKSVIKYMEDSIVSLIAIPSIPGKEIDMEIQRFANLLPVDAVSTFFTLLVGKQYTITGRLLLQE